ncbi:MAG: hypothetical protein A3D74_03920 [Candidatus Levybacteria bacterium RIFCSPHIGHO2_02_FULL_37_13]|nr:MAG: hypothetical protein A3D74_03920 [Candidatus Levybacteria bacterium RIFCSPHIGHO2_02_FULL_37_13]OGH39596.1 MAG: hypothetical protein A3B41_01930 [Candidatus Levybacteria bacterium RIFCSPLOWO2_01_FULL_37_26]
MNSSPVLVSVIIGTYNHKHYLSRNLQALQKQKVTHEIILVDDCSTDDTSDYVKRYFPHVKVIRQTKNQGFPAAINRGARNAHGKYLFLANADMEVSENYLSMLVDFLEKHREIAAVQGAIYDYEKQDKIVTTGFLFNPNGIIVSDLRYRKNVNQIHEILAGDALLVRAKAFRQINGYDEVCRFYYQDVDFGWRLWLAGYRINCLPLARMYHKGRGSVNTIVFTDALRHNLYVSIKNLDTRNVFLAIFTRLLISLIGSLIFMVRGQLNYIFGTVGAWIWVISRLPMILKKRKQIQVSRRISDASLKKEAGGEITFGYLRETIPIIFRRV